MKIYNTGIYKSKTKIGSFQTLSGLITNFRIFSGLFKVIIQSTAFPKLQRFTQPELVVRSTASIFSCEHKNLT